jgi:DNA modification methylase
MRLVESVPMVLPIDAYPAPVVGVAPLMVVHIPIASLTPDPMNPRAMPPDQMEALKHSLATFGAVEPAVVRRADMMLVGGHQRVSAAKALGWTEFPVVLVDLTDEQARTLNLALNKIHGEWDIPKLAELLASLPADLAALTGFDEHELRKVAREAEMAIRAMAQAADADDIPEPPAVPTARPGDLWILGDHRLACGDSTDPAVVARVLQGDEPRLLLTDPPYGVSLDMEWRDRAGLNALGPAQPSYMRGEGHRNTAISGDTRADWSAAFELVPSLDVGYVWHASAHASEVAAGLVRVGFEIKQQIIWRKPHFALSRQHYHWQHEPCWYVRKPGSERFLGSRDQSTIWDAASPKMLMTGGGEEKVDHPTQKPVALYSQPIQNHLAPGELLYEPFSGGGTAIVASEMTKVRCRAIEIDPRFIDVAVLRWERLTGKKALRA